MGFLPVKYIRRILFWLLFLCITLLGVTWLVSEPRDIKYSRADWVNLRLKKNQHEYVDHRGVHVVIGHYIGDDVSNRRTPNVTHDMINSNYFNPISNEGANGNPVVIPPKDLLKMQQLYQINRFNLLASDRIPLNRTLPDVRKKKCINMYRNLSKLPTTTVIIVFHNEAWSTLLRTVWSVINRSPRELLQEILLIDDASDRDFLRQPLDDYISGLPVSTRVIRSPERVGLIKARLMGAEVSQGEVLTFLDAHCECTIGWLESLLDRISQNRKNVVCPVIDIISDDTFAYIKSFQLHWGAFNWALHFRWFTLQGNELKKRKLNITTPFYTPTMAGGLFAIDKKYFFELGAYDEEMKIWGGENIELSFRIWQCGGKIEIVPCSHVGHIFRKSSPYTFPGGISDTLYANTARVALVWMDEWANFYFKFNPEADKLRPNINVEKRLEIRQRLKCKSFKWYLNHVWPQHFFPMDDRFFGRIRNPSQNLCLHRPNGKGRLNQPMGVALVEKCLKDDNLIEMFVMTKDGFIMTDDSVCVDGPDQDVTNSSDVNLSVNIVACSDMKKKKWTFLNETKQVRHKATELCWDIHEKSVHEHLIVLNPCVDSKETQKWIFEKVSWR
ncbi:polypeptide N-acetylgalactosaminyltransferase 3-like [Chrysoperla carnea]|uniref:polypeptide N-acetylgalactosaminyltransferase 3-like n=1 Tax=Chrysoperla carnea TaxID=189513 RepID=UPI001D089A0C|nr:polypeptide N-acetylgalactosaminyltransferase 3-like [Chrysoperla carnea]XP_044738006.1 polypeptide N-acetylgalactosaminyltransferase 3-like [Chrysoperla carnea]